MSKIEKIIKEFEEENSTQRQEKIKFDWIHRDLITRRSKGTIFTGRIKRSRRG